MKEQDKLRNTLQEYYDNQEVSFSENDWEQASAYLEAARRGRKKRYAVLIFLTLISGALLLFFSFPGFKDSKQLPVSLASKVNANPETAFSEAPALLPATEKSQNNKTSVAASHKKQNAGKDVFPDSQSSLKISKPQQVVLYTESNNSPGSESDFSAAHPAIHNNLVKEEVLTEQSVLHSGVTMSKAKTTNTGTTSKTTDAFSGSQETTKTMPVKPEDPATGQDLSPIQDGDQILTPALVQTKEAADLSETKKEKIGLDTSRANLAPYSTTVAAENLSAKTAEIILLKEETGGLDTLTTASVNDPYVRDGIIYEVGAAGYYGWKGPVKTDARGISPVAGIGYINRLSNRSAFSFGLQYLQVRNLSNSGKTSRVSSYIYGEQSSVTVITPSTLHYLAAPLRFHYFVTRQTSFGIGVNLAYLLNVDATVTTYEEKPGFTGNYKTIKQGRYMDGFSWYDSQLAFCYRRKIYNALALQAEVFIGLTDVKQDDFFRLNQKERNSGAKLSLVYYVFRKNEK